jgi:hypothetical protein
MTRDENAKNFAWSVLSHLGYNYALSDVEDACQYLDHPELIESDKSNYHKWKEPYPRRCYCGAIGYTDHGRFYAINASESHQKLMRSIFPNYKNHYGEPYPSQGTGDGMNGTGNSTGGLRRE